MVNWPFGEPQAINNFAYRADVARLMRQRAKSAGHYHRLAEKIHGRYLEGIDFMPGVKILLDIATSVNDIKVATIGVKSPADAANFLTHLVMAMFLRQAEIGANDLARLKELSSELEAAKTSESWYWPKVRIIHNLAEGIRDTELYAEFVSASLSPLVETALGVFPDIDQRIREVMAELLNLRKYGVKSCYFQDGILHRADQAWVFADFHELESRMNPLYRQTEKHLAAIVLTKRAEIEHLRVSRDQINVGSSLLLSVGFDFKGMSWAVDYNGELDISGSTSLISVRDIFRRTGKEPLYELVRMMHVLRLYDLVVPVDVVRKMPPLPQQKKGVRRLLGKVRPARIAAPELLVPRLRQLETIQRIIAELERECEEADKATIERAPRELRQHEVVNHIRQLPAGHHPSAKARERARRELGIELRDNETYVCRHIRGQGADVGPHKAKRR